ncbi:MAG: hypothetical protein RMI01_09810, partial [Thermodesulfovibrio sp.]|nr:hypothetical protein [Thermodesulfovibrio sp.]
RACMKLSQIYDILFALCSHDLEQVVSIFPYIAWSYENGLYSILYNKNSIQVLFYGFTTVDKAKKVVEKQSWIEFARCLSDRLVDGEVMIVIFAGGKIDKYGFSIFKKLLKELKVKGILFYKRKIDKYIYMEV